MLRFEEALARYRKRRLTAEEAGELLGMSGRHFRRLSERYDEEGRDGLRDRRLGKPSPRRAPAAELTRMQRLYQERYRDFTVKHFHEQLQKRHGYTLCYTVTRLALQAAGLVSKTKRGGPHRKRRERRPLPGMLLFQDGSTHRWIAALDRDLDVGRALQQLGITHIPSYSPEARGRMERVFGTLQSRLPPELRLAGITTIAAANRYLNERFVPDYNARFAVAAAEAGSAFIPYAGRPLEDVLSIQDDRQVGRDNCVQWNGLSLQIPPQPHRHHYVKATVRVHEYPDGRLAIFDGPSCLARFDHKGKLINASRAA